MELWKPVDRNPDYEISNQGRVRRVTGTHGTRAGRELKQRQDKRGYTIVSIPRVGVKPNEPGYVGPVFVHRLVATAFIEGGDPSLDVNHKNFDRTDNRVENLEWCTHAYNMAYSRSAGRWPDFERRGASNGHSKLTEDDVRTIRALRAAGVKRVEVAARYGISGTQVRTITMRKQWAHVD